MAEQLVAENHDDLPESPFDRRHSIYNGGADPEKVDFSKDEFPKDDDLVFPGAFQLTKGWLEGHAAIPAVRGTQDVNERKLIAMAEYNAKEMFYWYELDVTPLERIQRYLWIAAEEPGSLASAKESPYLPPKALHKQLAIGRTILLTEVAAQHLLWEDDKIYIKPMPSFLLCHSVWEEYLCMHRPLYRWAVGFVITYISLVCSQSDLAIAHAHYLLPQSVSWQKWAIFSRQFLGSGEHLDRLHRSKSRRYQYGELRLNRLNWIAFLHSSGKTLSFLTESEQPPWTVNSYLHRNTTELATLAIFVGLILTAMQVGLGTNVLGDNRPFQDTSYRFTLISIFGTVALYVAVIYTASLLTIIQMFRAYIRRIRSEEFGMVEP